MRSCIRVTMAMDAKDLRTESALSERNNNGSKYSQSGGIALQCDRNKPYQDIGSNSLGKVDVQSARPCAVIGPDRVVPLPASNEAYLKKGPTETWPCMENTYHTRRPPEYPHKLTNFQNPTRNISPRQTYQENMQRIMVPPSYNSVKISDDTNYAPMSERSNILPKNIKLNVPPEAKFCEVPYSVYPTSTEQKNVRNPEMCLPSVNPTLTRTAPHGWPPGSVNIRPTRAYGAPELYQYQDYSSCAGPRPVVQRPNRTVPEEPSYVYADPFYHQEGNIRFKPYPTVKERVPQQRYDYVSNYANSFHPPPAFPSHKYDLQKNVPPHPYAPYPQIKYLDRVSEPVMEGYQRNQQGVYNMQPYRNQIIHPNYGSVLGNCSQNKIHSYPPDGHIKNMPPNKLPYDNAKAYIEYENGRPKMYPPSESYLINEMGRMHPMKSQVIMPNYPSINMHNIPPNSYYKKDSLQMKNYEYLQAHYRGMDPNINMHNPMVRHPSVFSPNTLAISPTDSSASNDTSQTIGTSQEDCGYVSQSSSASVRSMDSSINRIPNDYIRKYYDSRFGPIIRTSSMMSKSDLNSSHNSKEKKNLDVRQFLQMWNEGEEETEENIAKEIIVQTGPKGGNSFSKSHEGISQQNQEQLYVLGLVNVPSEELGKYEHIQKVSKLPENIKGYNHLELLNQFEEAIESSNMPNYKISPNHKDFKMQPKGVPIKQATSVVPPRPLSPLDVEAKISQSVIHKEVGCNFEIKPCSPKMLNVEVATPVQNILAERTIEKVANPVMLKSPRLNSIDENMDCNIMKRKDHRMNINNEPVRIPSCKMVNTQFSDSNGIDSIKNSYSLQDLESNSGLCLASLPRLDNDIELNFPEVNQQFINANKRDSTVLTSSLKALPSLEVFDQSDRQNKDNLNDINSLTRENDFIKSPIDSDKEFSKLSKYRKSKPHLLGSKDNLNAVRTDSVIIKNPENSKNYEEHSVFSPTCLNKQMCDIQQTPMNLTSQVNITENIDNTNKPLVVDKELDSSIEIAIDFSLNKNTSNDNVECLKNDHDIDILKNNTNNVNQSTDKQLTQLPLFSDSDQNTQHAYINHDKLDENIISSPTGGIHTEAKSPKSLNNSNDKEIVNSIDTLQPEQIFEKSEFLSTPNVNEINNEDDYMSSVAPVKEIDDISTNSLLPVEFATPPAELERTAESDNYFTKNNDTSRICLEENKSNLTEGDVDDKQNQSVKDYMKINQKCGVDNDTTNNEKFKGENVAGCETVNEDVKSESDTVTPKDSECSHAKDSSIFEVSEKIDCESPNQKMLNNIFYQSENILQKNDIHLVLSPLSSIASPIRDDYHSDTERISDVLDFPSSNNIQVHSPTHALLNATECDIGSNFDKSPNNVAADNRDDCALEANNEENCANFDISSNNKELTNNRDNDPSKVTTMEEREDDSNLKPHSPNNIVTLTQDMSKHTTVENDYNFKLSVPNNIETRGQDNELSSSNETPTESSFNTDPSKVTPMEEREDDYNFKAHSPNNIVPLTQDMSKHTKVENDNNFNLSVPNNIETRGQDNDLSYSNETPTESSFNLLSPNNKYQPLKETNLPTNDIVTKNTNCDVKKENDSLDFLEDISDERKDNIDDNNSKDIFLTNDKVTSVETTCSEKSITEELTLVHRRIRYLTYGSKEMYSPWIQKLIMFCEGNIGIAKSNIEDKNSNHYGLPEMEDSCSFDNSEMHQSNSEAHNVDNCILPYIENCLVETPNLNPSDGLAIGNVLKIDDEADNCVLPNIENCLVETPKLNSSDGLAIGNVLKIDDESDNCVLPNIENCLVETPKLNPSDGLAIENDSRPDNNGYYDTCVTEDENIIECNKHKEPNPFHEKEESNSPVECMNNAKDNNKNSVSSMGSSILNDTTHNSTNHSDKLINPLSNLERDSCYSPQAIKKDWDKKSICGDEIPGYMDQQSHYSTNEQWDKEYDSDAEILEQWDRQSNFNNNVLGRWDNTSDNNDDAYKDSVHHQKFHKQSDDNEVPGQVSGQSDEVEVFEEPDKRPNCNDSELEPSATVGLNESSSTNLQTSDPIIFSKNRQLLKRSLSDSALGIYDKHQQPQEKEQSVHFIWPFKRRKMNNLDNDMLAQNLCNIIQSNRRNSISSICNEENVSFCILIDNSCILAEEENDDQEKICYTELPEECLAEIHNDCTKHEDNSELMTEVITTQEPDQCEEYSDSYVMQYKDEKVEESWVEDVACVETVISDDIAEDIEISGSSSPKDDELSDNDESGVFSSSEHTDKVKYIYGDKMCNDDAQFVETLYNTPQMDVNKTLVQRESIISGEYYDNDSLEKILSESNDREPPYVAPYVPDYTEPVFSPGIINVTETIDNKENMDVESISPLQSNTNPSDIVDTGIDNTKPENVTMGKILKKNRDSIVHSCESSVDNVFTYKENDDNTSYTSSSPEVSSTTSEEKNSSILLKITNYKGSRISQINDISRDNTRPSCKFTEDKDYVQSHSNFPTHRPLLTKAAQKYIPPLKESMRDLKVKLSLPQHSLMKLKQLKKSKDKPKVCKQNIPVPSISKKPKPKFEDVLKSIDEIHFKMHKEKTKKSKKSIPKVVIKKNENGSHYASSSNKDEFNPDLTGRKWQPWVFIEKNHFIDKMAIKNKTKAVYSHRKRTYVLAEKFYKYRSANSGKFVISPPISDSPPTGLKYTIRLKHSY